MSLSAFVDVTKHLSFTAADGLVKVQKCEAILMINVLSL